MYKGHVLTFLLQSMSLTGHIYSLHFNSKFLRNEHFVSKIFY